MSGFDSFVPSDRWQIAGVHWHGYVETRTKDSARHGDRSRRLEQTPDAVLRTPDEVAGWIESRTGEHVLHREVFALHERMWVSIGDEDDTAHLYVENLLIASRGDSIYTDIYAEDQRRDLYAEVVSDEQCIFGGTDQDHANPA